MSPEPTDWAAIISVVAAFIHIFISAFFAWTARRTYRIERARTERMRSNIHE